ncbi:MAG: bifunctional diguanylate cyclase/phosphodiesterase [Pseudomonadota bacterium]|nr:bifunctional diguanylate cyclase/phosphodiesterase [Pseudomonadota bacterium]
MAEPAVLAAATLDEIIATRAVTPVFQPVVNLAGGWTVGFEALARGPVSSALHAPSALFRAAEEAGCLAELESLCRIRAVEAFAEADSDRKLFLNISAQLLCGNGQTFPAFRAALKRLDIPPQRIVIELSEQQPYHDIARLKENIAAYRRFGFQIAIDDLGTGYSGLKLWSEVHPDYVKIDRHFVSGIDSDLVKREFVRSIVAISQGLDCQVIAEGIETPAELLTVRKLGIQMGQGFLLASPAPVPTSEIEPQPALSDPISGQFLGLSETARSLAKPAPAVAPGLLMKEVLDVLQDHPGQNTLAVVDENRQVIGVLHRNALVERFSQRFGRALYERRCARELMDQHGLVVDAEVPLEALSQLVTASAESDVHQNIIITDKGRFFGTGSFTDLLRKITELKIHNARYANPLTLLPGSVPINTTIDRLLAEHADFRVAYCDLNHFKPYNDHYGYAKGDQVLQLVGDLLNRLADNERNLVGHIGGDDFVVVFQDTRWKLICQRILADFDALIGRHYDSVDAAAGGIWAPDRRGVETFHPCMGLAVGVVHPDPEQCHSSKEVASLATAAKLMAKKSNQSALFVSRRRGPG